MKYRVFKIIKCQNDPRHQGVNSEIGDEPLGGRTYSSLNAAYYAIYDYYKDIGCGCRCEVKEVEK